ncbi:MAG TPA: hypothetical protein VHY19_09055 [Steroidobacteraceae bacterium]|nr:hypothetical protein [Steroidobacteraceae bacterium]
MAKRYVELNQDLADPSRESQIPDEVLDKAKQAIVLDDLKLHLRS